jgi:hypothetical protein
MNNVRSHYERQKKLKSNNLSLENKRIYPKTSKPIPFKMKANSLHCSRLFIESNNQTWLYTKKPNKTFISGSSSPSLLARTLTAYRYIALSSALSRIVAQVKSCQRSANLGENITLRKMTFY